jgi:tetratricopeptide (TPR) repeat protein
MKLAAAIALAALWCWPLTGPLSAQEGEPRRDVPSRQSPSAEPLPRVDPAEAAKVQLDKLFERLAAAEDEEEANGIAQLIERRWLRSGSDTADLLMSRAVAAVNARDFPLAIEILDRIVVLEPKWAEAWNKRATVFFMMGDYERAVVDVRETLALEPRHFGAWSGLGIIFQAIDDNKRALEAFRKALAIHPFIGSVRSLVERLTPTVEGRDL